MHPALCFSDVFYTSFYSMIVTIGVKKTEAHYALIRSEIKVLFLVAEVVPSREHLSFL